MNVHFLTPPGIPTLDHQRQLRAKIVRLKIINIYHRRQASSVALACDAANELIAKDAPIIEALKIARRVMRALI